MACAWGASRGEYSETRRVMTPGGDFLTSLRQARLPVKELASSCISFQVMSVSGYELPRPEGGDSNRTVEKLFLTHSGAIKGFIHALLRDRNLVDDVLQETFLVISAKAHTFQSGTNFVAWACTIARFKVLETIRRHGREQQFLRGDVIEALAQEMPRSDERETMLRHLDSCLRELGRGLRQLIDLRYFQQRDLPEIARTLSLTVDSTYVMLSRARRALRMCIAGKLAQPRIAPE